MNKKRILFITEASYLRTGFATLGRELLKRLYKSGKYEIAEFGIYGYPDDPQSLQFPWMFYGNMPGSVRDKQGQHPNSNFKQETQLYNSNPMNQFGNWRFNDVALDFKPHIVLDIRDPWHLHAHDSPLRKYFNIIYQPTVDSSPQKTQWLAFLQEVEGVFTYSDWGTDVLEREGGGKINVLGRTGIGVDFDIYKPLSDKLARRQRFGLTDDTILVGFFARNQKRKLFPDLCQAFRLFLDTCKEKGNDALANRSYLYFHTSYPDIGWDFPTLLKEHGLAHKVYFTYVCRKCKFFFPSFFQDARTMCPHCGDFSAGLPNTQAGVTEEILASIYNMLDVYVQYSISEGFGNPIVEAAACGVPVMICDHTGMRDFPKTLKAIPIKNGHEFKELETHAYRYYPDNNDLVAKLYKFLTLPKQLRQKQGYETGRMVRKNYDWDKIASQWIKVLDEIPSKKPWNSPPDLHQVNYNIPDNLSNEDFVNWCLVNVAGEPEYVNTFVGASLLKDLNYEVQLAIHEKSYLTDMSYFSDKPNTVRFDRKKLAEYCEQKCLARNQLEQLRVKTVNIPTPWHIQIAHERMELLRNG